MMNQVPLFVLSRLLSSLWVSRTGSASDWCALQEALYKCIDPIQYNTIHSSSSIVRVHSLPLWNASTNSLEHCSKYARCAIVGDNNIPLDIPENVHANAFVSELQIHDLVERVQQPTHCKGHQLDVFISRADDPMTSIRIDQPSQLSDHLLIVASFDDVDAASTVARERSRVQRRRWRNFDIDRFKADLQQSELVRNPSQNVNELFEFTATLYVILSTSMPPRLR